MDKRKKKKASETHRHLFQGLWAVISNGFLAGFASGRIYTGDLKKLCLPGLNCYSCPGALGSCPIGAMQSVLNTQGKGFSFYVCGFMIFIGAVFGRFVCGWLCPFGLLQDLLWKIPFVRKLRDFRGDKLLRRLKYVILLLFVIILPLFALDEYGTASPAFCKYICPAGTLEGSVPLMIVNETLRASVGFLYTYKLAILIILIILSVIIYRPFCKYICPLGAVYSVFNKVSLFRIRKDEGLCTDCKACNRVCKMNVDVSKNPNGAECIRCGLCVKACPENALSCFWVKDKKGEKATENKENGDKNNKIEGKNS